MDFLEEFDLYAVRDGERSMNALVLNSAMQDIQIRAPAVGITMDLSGQADVISAALGPKSPLETYKRYKSISMPRIHPGGPIMEPVTLFIKQVRRMNRICSGL